MNDPLTIAMVTLLAIAPITGSFLGTVVLRVPAGQSVVTPRSACDSCGHVLGLVDLLPVINWIVSRGRCRYCGTSVPAFYPLIELSAIAVVVRSWMVTPGWARVGGVLLGWALMALLIMDLRRTVLPDRLTLSLLPIGLVAAWWNPLASLVDHALGAVAGLVIGAALVVAAHRLGRRTAPGMGEAKLLAAGGAWVGWPNLLAVAVVAAVAAVAIAVLGRVTALRPFADGRIAAGAAIGVGVWLVWLYGGALRFN